MADEREIFVNRQEELHQLASALDAFRQAQPDQSRSPTVFVLAGVTGIGKTALLRQVQRQAQALGLPVHWQALAPRPGTDQEALATLDRLPAVRDSLLAAQQRAVLLLDDVDPNDLRQLQRLETLLRTPGPQAPLLLVLTAGQPLWFWEPAFRPLQQLELAPLDPASSEALLDAVAPTLAPEGRALALHWADGYPLALVVLAQALRDGRLDPRQPADRARLLEQLTERVLRQGVLGTLPPAERPAAEQVLRLLAVPRRFTAMLLQDLLEQFAPELTQAHPFHYFLLPQRLSVRTSALHWQPERAGYAVVAPVRHLLLLLWREQDPARWREIQGWLATFWHGRARQGREGERIAALLDWGLQRLLLGDPPSQLLSELAAWPWPSPEERRRALAALGQEQDLLQLLGEQAAAWQAALQALSHPS